MNRKAIIYGALAAIVVVLGSVSGCGQTQENSSGTSQESSVSREEAILASIHKDASGKLVSDFGVVREVANPRETGSQAVAAIRGDSVMPFGECWANPDTGVVCCVDGHIDPPQYWCSGK
jgi:hypothetical protein